MRTLHFAAALFVMSGLMAWAQAPQGQSDEHPKFPPGPGRDVTIRVCSQCHDAEYAANQQFDEMGWKRLVDDMAAMGADASEEELEQIVEYLAKAFPAESPAQK